MEEREIVTSSETSMGNKTKKYIPYFIVVAFVLIAIVSVYQGKKNKVSSSGAGQDNSDLSVNESEYWECVSLDSTSMMGAVFTMSFSEVKNLIGRELQIGEANNSSGGWEAVYSSDECTEYSILSSTGLWGVNIGVDKNGKVIMVVCTTSFSTPTNTEFSAFAKVFAKLTNLPESNVENLLRENFESGNKSGKNIRSYYGGVQSTYEKMDGGGCRFGMTSMSQEYWESIQ